MEMKDGTHYTILRKSTVGECDLVGSTGLFDIFYPTPYRICGNPYLSSIEFPTGEFLEFDVEAPSVSDKPNIRGFTLKTDEGGTDLKTLEIFRDNANRIIAIYAPSETDTIPSSVANPLEYRDNGTPTVKYFYKAGYLSQVYKLKDKGPTGDREGHESDGLGKE